MATTISFQYSHTIGFYSNRDKGFQHPVDVALDSLGVLYVLSRAGPEVSVRIPYKRITICTVEEEYLGEFSTGGMGDGDLWWPSSLAFDSDDTLYVADEALNRISMFAKNGRYLGQWGSEGAGDGQRYVGFQQRDAHLAQGGFHVLIGQCALLGQALKDPRESIGQVLEHVPALLRPFNIGLPHVGTDRPNANDTSGRNSLTGGDPG